MFWGKKTSKTLGWQLFFPKTYVCWCRFFSRWCRFGREKNLTFFPKPASFFSKPERIPACRFFIEVGFGKNKVNVLKMCPNMGTYLLFMGQRFATSKVIRMWDVGNMGNMRTHVPMRGHESHARTYILNVFVNVTLAPHRCHISTISSLLSAWLS